LKFGGYVYLNQTINENDEFELTNIFRGSGDPVSQIFHKQLHRILSELSFQEEKVLKLRYGIERNEMTLQEIGDLLGLSRERIRQIEVTALRKCKKILSPLTTFQ
jgi:RNA polymerase sigma factor (sigma-70 family)